MWNDISIIDLIQKYNISGPRYTSYPPAPVFSPGFGPNDYRDAVIRTERNPESEGVSLYFHIPFCDTLCYFCGCTTIVTRNRDHFEEYLGYLTKEISLLGPLLHEKRKVVQMHWGGGTPTYLSPSQIRRLSERIRGAFLFAPDAEVSVEIDPRDLSYHHLRALREQGFNRISMGVQDFDPKVQHAVNRNQSEFITRQAIGWSRDLGFSSLNVDLIYGLPLQSVSSFEATLDKIIDIQPDRIATYNFAFVPWMKKQQVLIHPEDLPSAETKIRILATTIEKLTAAGYVYIGMDHFARPDDELTVARREKTLHRNFQGYSTKADSDLYGLGMSSIGHFGTTYAQNAKTLPEYYEAIGSGRFATAVGYGMTPDDRVRKFVIMKLMCDLSLNIREVEQKFGIEFGQYFDRSIRRLQPLLDDGLVEVSPAEITVTSPGRLFLRNIAMCFDAYVAENAGKPLYSKTV